MPDADQYHTDTSELIDRSTTDGSNSTTSVTQTSASLIHRVQANDPEAWDRLVRLYSPLVYFWCSESGLPEADVHDLFQDVFHALTTNIVKYRPTKNGSFRGWLRTVTRNKVNDHFRRSNRHPQAVGGTEALRCIEQVPDHLTNETNAEKTSASSREYVLKQTLYRNALENIRPFFSENSWRVFLMVAIEGRETSDVASELSMKPGTVRVIKSRILNRLKLELGDFTG